MYNQQQFMEPHGAFGGGFGGGMPQQFYPQAPQMQRAHEHDAMLIDQLAQAAASGRGLEVGSWIGPSHYTVLSGYPEISGYEISGPAQGALMQTHPALSRPSPAAMPQPMSGLHLTDRDPRNARVLWLGFKSSTTIAAATNSNVSASPQDVFAARKVIVPATVAPNFEIADLKVGAVSQFSSSDPLPAEAFIPDAVTTDVRFDTAQISQQITFNVNNISAAAATFRAALNGFVARM